MPFPGSSSGYDTQSLQAPTPLQTTGLTPQTQQPPSRTSSLIFVDAGVQDAEELISNRSANAEVVYLSTTEDAVDQITRTLLNYQGINSVHIFSHGDSGRLNFNNGWLGGDNISHYTAQIKSWSQALSTNADILLYGCDVAGGVAGAAFIRELGMLAHADIAASTNKTGKGGDWVLEAQTGSIEAAIVPDQASQVAYNYSLDQQVKLLSQSDPTLASSAVGGAMTDRSVSQDGKLIVFSSAATNLVIGDTNNSEDVFLYDRSTPTPTITLISSIVGDPTQSANGKSAKASISKDGRYVTFLSNAKNLTADVVTGNTNQLYRWDLKDKKMVLISQLAAVVGDGDVSEAVMSDDGSSIAFISTSSNLSGKLASGTAIVDDNSGKKDAFLWRETAGPLLISMNSTTLKSDSSGVNSDIEISGNGNFVTFNSSSNLLIPSAQSRSNVYVYDVANSDLSIASFDANNDVAFGASVSPAKVSVNGNKLRVVFSSSFPATGDTNAVEDVFIAERDLSPGSVFDVKLVSLKPDGLTSGNGDSSNAVISANGRYIAFTSSASDLVTGDTNAKQDVFIRDLDSLTPVATATRLVSRNSKGEALGDGASSKVRISDDGNIVTFISAAKNLVGGLATNDPNGAGEDVFAYSRTDDTLTLVSQKTGAATTTADLPANPQNIRILQTPIVSADGSTIVYASDATNIVAKDTNDAADVFAFNVAPPANTPANALVTTVVSNQNSVTGAGNSTIQPIGSVSKDGKYVVFSSTVNSLVTGDTNAQEDVFLRDTTLLASDPNALKLISRSSVSTKSGNGVSSQPFISADGKYVVFSSTASDLIPGDTNLKDIFLYDVTSGAITAIVSRTTAALSNAISDNASIAVDASGTIYIAFTSRASNLGPTVDLGGFNNVYLWKKPVTGAETIALLSRTAAGTGGNQDAITSIVSADGKYVAFSSNASNLEGAVADGSNTSDVFLYDITANTLKLVSQSAAGAVGNGSSFNPVISDVGGVVAFESNATNLTAITDANGVATDIFRSAAGVVSLVSVNAAGTATGNEASGQQQVGQQSGFTGVSLSSDGSSIAFTSLASDLSETTDTNTKSDVFVRNSTTNKTTLISQVAGTASKGASNNVVISGDGQTVAFISTAINLSPRDTDANADVYISSATTPAPGLISSNVAGTGSSNAAAGTVSLNRDGGFVVFDSRASNLVANDANGFSDIFLRPTKSIVSLKATTSTAKEGSATENGVYELTRTDGTGTLQVKLKLDTLLPNGAKPEDFTLTADGGVALPIALGIATVTFADSISKVTLTLKAIADSKAEADETAKFTLDLDGTYSIDPIANSGTVTIAANETIVTNNADTAEGSLRQAIANANAFTGPDTISFALADPTQKTIALTTELAALNTGTVINGGTAGIILDGALAGATANGLTLTGDNNTVNNITIQNFKGNGIVIAGNNNTIGGTTTATANTITLNNEGVVVQSGTGNRILGNKITANTLLGIDIAPIGADTAPAIVFTTALPTPTGATLTGTLTKPAGVYRVEFFANTTQDVSLQGEGELFLGSKDITVDASGTAAVTFDATAVGLTGKYIAATVTDAAGSTSEFAKNKLITPPLPLVELTASVPELLEGTSGIVSKYKFNVTLSQAVTTPLTLSYRTLAGAAASGIATAGTDYTAVTTGTVTIAANTSTASFDIDITGDTRYEVDETFQVELFGLDAAVVASGTLIATGKIKNDDDKPTISFSQPTVSKTEGQVAPNGTIPFTVNLSNASDEAITVAYKTIDGTAISTAVGANPVDFIGIPSGTLTFAPGEITKDLSVEIIADTVDEPIETFTVELSTPTNATFTASANQITAIGNITPDELPRVDLTASVPELLEGNSGTSKYTFTVKLNQITTAPITLNYRTLAGAAASGIATAGTDYTAITTGTVTIGANSDTATFDIDILGDTRYEVDETFQVELSGLDAAVVSSGTLIATGKIKNDDAKPTISFTQNAVSQAEGQVAPNGKMPFTVNLSNASDETITVAYKTIDGTAISTAVGPNPADFIAVPTTPLTFAPGDLTKDIAVEIVADILDEPADNFTVELSAPTNATFAASAATISATGTIVPDEKGYVFSVLPLNVPTVIEGALGTTKTVTFTVALDRVPTEDLTVNYSTVDGTAIAGIDYVNKKDVLTFKAGGPLTQTVDVVVNGDDLANGNRDFTLDLNNPTAVRATIDPAKQTSLVTIIDDDLPKISFNTTDVKRFEGPNGQVTQVGVVVELSAISDKDVTVEFTTLDGTGPNAATVADNDYVPRTLAGQKITIAKGQLSTTAFFTINGDDKIETDETFLVKLSSPIGATLNGPDTKSIVILNDDQALINPPNVSITANPDATQTEGNSGTKSFSFTITLDKAPTLGKDVTVNVATIDGVGLGGATSIGTSPDFTAKTQALTFIAGGPLSQTFTVLVNGDTQVEPTETFTVQLSGATNSTLVTNSAIGTITDDDAPVSTPKLTLTAIKGSDTEGNTGTKTLTYAVTLDQAPTAGKSVTVDVATVDGTGPTGATSTGPSADFVAKTQTLTFLPTGALTQEFSVTINGDTQPEATETFNVELRNVNGAVITTGTAIGTITDDDTPISIPKLSLTPIKSSDTEGNTGTKTLTYAVTLDQAPTAGKSVTVDVATVDGTGPTGATSTGPSADFVAKTQTLTFLPTGALTQEFSVTVNGDTQPEATETFNVELKNVNGAVITNGNAIGTITDDDTPISIPKLSITPIKGSDTEGNTGTKTLTYAVTLDQAPTAGKSVTVDVATVDGTGPTGATSTGPSTDFVAKTQTLTFLPTGPLTQEFSVTINGDTQPEATETFNVELRNVNGAVITTGNAIGTITDDDTLVTVPPILAISSVSLTEGNGGTKPFVFDVNLTNGPADRAFTVNYEILDGSATLSDNDYQLPASNRTGTVTFNKGDTKQSITVLVNGDTKLEGNETFTVKLSNPTNSASFTPGGDRGIGSILNDDITDPGNNISLDSLSDLLWRNPTTGETVVWQTNLGPTTKTFNAGSLRSYNSPEWRYYGSADFDGDGDTDPLWHNTQTGELHIWKMNGSLVESVITDVLPSLLSGGRVAAEWSVKDISDYNQDGSPDLIWYNARTGAVDYWAMNGLRFLSGGTVQVVNDLNWKIEAAANFSGDPQKTLFWRNQQTGRMALWRMGAGQISSASYLNFSLPDLTWQVATTADLNGDGTSDLVWQNRATNAISVWYMNRSGFISDTALQNPGDGYRVKASGDFNQDGVADLLLQNSLTGQNQLWYFQQSPKGIVYSNSAFLGNTIPGQQFLGLGQLDRSTPPSLLWINTTTGDLVTWQIGKSLYGGESKIAALSNLETRILATVDLNRDGKAELLVRDSTTGAIELGDLTNKTYNRITLLPPLDSSWGYLGSGDADADGDQDLYWQNQTTGKTLIWQMNGYQYVTTLSPLEVGPEYPGWRINQVADFNGDGKADFFWRNTETNATAVWIMDGAAIQSSAFMFNVDQAWKIVKTIDLDRDGKVDLIWRNSETGQNSVWLMNGSALKRGIVLPTVTDLNWQIKEVNDFDRDGNADILWYNSRLQTAVFWTLRNGQFINDVVLPKVTNSSWDLVGTRDFNADGSRDLLWLDKATGTPTIWFMDGTKYGTSASLPNLSSPNFQLLGIDDYAQTPT